MLQRRGRYFLAFTICGAATLGLFVARGPEPSDSVMRRLYQRWEVLRGTKISHKRQIGELIGKCIDEKLMVLGTIIKENLDVEYVPSPQQKRRHNQIDQLQPELDECEAEIEEILDEIAIDKDKRDALARRRAVYTGAALFTGILSVVSLICFVRRVEITPQS